VRPQTHIHFQAARLRAQRNLSRCDSPPGMTRKLSIRGGDKNAFMMAVFCAMRVRCNAANNARRRNARFTRPLAQYNFVRGRSAARRCRAPPHRTKARSRVIWVFPVIVEPAPLR
jgi:hypothetical protein